MRDLPAALDQFRPHPVTDVTGPKHAASRAVFERAVIDLWAIVPDGPEKTLVMRKLQEASMLSNVAIALSGSPAEEPALERNEHAFRGGPIMQIPVVVYINGSDRGHLVRPGTWAVPELREELGISDGWDLWFVDFYSVRIPLHESETLTVHDGQRFVTTSRKPERADAPS